MPSYSRILVLLLTAVAACSDPASPAVDANPLDGAVADAVGPIDAAVDGPPLDAQPGLVTVRGNNVTGASGRILLAVIGPIIGGPAAGSICVPVTSDPFSFTATFRTYAMDNPCDQIADLPLADGIYTIRGGLFVPGSMMPELCVSTTVTVTGGGDVTLPALTACP